ncbi:MAG: phage tail assembly protein [Candidatus Accumulibacter sp.]|jgi:hypothetical protein|nr:phage tail assembly protein [Accumulibacter sp.]
MMEKISIPLSAPVYVHGESVSEIVLREPLAGDLRSLPVGRPFDMGLLLDLASAVSGWPPSAIDQLSVPDALKIVEALGGFLGGSTSETPPS